MYNTRLFLNKVIKEEEKSGDTNARNSQLQRVVTWKNVLEIIRLILMNEFHKYEERKVFACFVSVNSIFNWIKSQTLHILML